ncbi:hypothetical protein OF897_01295 [Chryseobacterium formosus]|uniref:Uncharacterized protein n=1 Tax=Chryseobacterium formosus TaxID=1537363 RepID=A0ABT3XK88_9FLAO|nr:hypothetical protein [Chryseobacterium formosus]MCX8522560.1 hypothetical protein [Chryseobacterium formosus]
MKKIFLVALLATASIASANDLKMEKNSEVKKETKQQTEKAKSERCYTYGMVAWCKPNDIIADTICYETSDPQGYDRSLACRGENTDLYNIFMCGTRDYAGFTNTIY